jgi:GNAT superfamily N-acetyltransferase
VVGSPVGSHKTRAGTLVIQNSGEPNVKTYINPEWLDPAAYLKLLNASYDMHWNSAEYEFYIGRSFNGRPSDLIVRASGEQVLSGLAFSYREVKIQERHTAIPIAVIGAAATLPSERGRGHYAKLLVEVQRRARDRGCLAVLGFVTRRNTSGRGLRRLGAHAIPSFYISSRRAGPRLVRGASFLRERFPHAEIRPRLDRALLESDPTVAHFHYEHTADWVSQFINRPHPIREIRLAHDVVALVESVSEPLGNYSSKRKTPIDRLQWLASPRAKIVSSIARLRRASEACGRRFFMYTLDPVQANAAKRAGLRITEGYLIILPAVDAQDGWRALASSAWCLQSGDRL